MRGILIILLTAVVLSACATSPTGRSQFMLISPEWAVEMSRSAYLSEVADLATERKLLEDRVLSDRVELIVGRLVAIAARHYPHTAGWEWSVALIDAPNEVNAWCMAGGRMAMYSGLVYKLDLTDDELAQVMGHEMSHAIANHTAEGMSMAIAQGLVVATIAAASEEEYMAHLLNMAAALAISLPNGRSAESEADHLGMELATLAGYDPDAAATLWQKMERQGGARPPEFLSTHPSPENRAERLRSMAAQMRYLSPASPPRPFQVKIYP